MGHACGRVEQAFRAAAEQDPSLESLGRAYDAMLADRELINVLLHGFALGGDPALGPVMRAAFGRIYQIVRELTGAGIEEARDFMAMGMLCTVLGGLCVIGPGAAKPEPWMADLAGSIDLDKATLADG